MTRYDKTVKNKMVQREYELFTRYHSNQYDKKGKAKVAERDRYLRLKIDGCDGIDEETMAPSLRHTRRYKLVVYVVPEDSIETYEVRGLPDPIWRVEGTIRIRKTVVPIEHLYVEVYRTMSVSYTGTSSGMRLVGRAKIPLPDMVGDCSGCESIGPKNCPECNYCRRYGLVVPKGSGYVAQGHISLNMKMKKED